MKKSFNLFLCILCCLFSLSACSQPEKSVEEHVNMAQEQLGKPLGEAYQALGLPGCRFEGNGTDIDNRSGQPLDLSQATFQ